MSKFMTIAGIIMAAVAVALGLMIFFSPSSVVGWGATPEAAINLLVGGILALGLGALIDAVSRLSGRAAVATADLPRASEKPVAVVAASAPAAEPLSPETHDTIRAIEEAKSQIRSAFEPAESKAVPAAEDTADHELDSAKEPAEHTADAEHGEDADLEADAEADAEEDDGQLYVVEEKVIRGRQARVLSDGTIEAETDEGWMRFENLEHINEYFDAMEPAR